MTLLLLFICVLGLAIFGLVTKAIRPYREAGAQKSQMTVTRRQIAEIDRQNVALHQHIAYLQTDDGMATEARKMGFVKPGEIPIVVESQAAPLTTPASMPRTTPLNSPAPHTRRGASRAHHFGHRLTGH